jgi:hypothetical protein
MTVTIGRRELLGPHSAARLLGRSRRADSNRHTVLYLLRMPLLPAKFGRSCEDFEREHM